MPAVVTPDTASATPRVPNSPRLPNALRVWSPRARLAGFAAVGAVAVGACVRVYLVDPARPGHYPTCPFRWATSLDCPGCGTLRGAHQLLHGHLAAAADRNLFFVIAAPILVLAWIVAVARAAGWRRPLPRVPPRLLPVIPVLIIAFWIVRNLPVPGGTWLAA
jgi:hypothetical protein